MERLYLTVAGGVYRHYVQLRQTVNQRKAFQERSGLRLGMPVNVVTVDRHRQIWIKYCTEKLRELAGTFVGQGDCEAFDVDRPIERARVVNIDVGEILAR